MNTFSLPRNLVIFGIVIPVALLLGYALAEPEDFMSLGVVGLLLGILSIPILLRWHHPILIFSWNLPLIISLLPGAPSLWMLMSIASFFLCWLAFALDRSKAPQNVFSITLPLIFLLLLAAITAKLTGGIGLRSLGNSVYGGRRYFSILMAVLGYFAISSIRIPQEKFASSTRSYFLSGLLSVMPNIAYMAGPAFWWLFFFFPVDAALDQAREDFLGPMVEAKFGRLTGTYYAGMGAICFMYARYGVAGLFDLRRWWRLVILLACVGIGSLGGFRSFIVLFGLIFVVQFMIEGLYRTRLALVFGLIAVMGTAVLIPFANKLPLVVQRSISFLPLNLNPMAVENAQGSLEWRKEMWAMVMPEIPKYFWIGKGYALDPLDLYLTQERVLRGLAKNNEYSALAGDYHNGPLSVIIPFGIFGVIAVLWFWGASLRWLYRAYRDGPDYLKKLNTFLLAYFVARIIFFIFGFGSLFSDLALFTGALGLSVALNGTGRESVAPQECAKPLTEESAAPVS